MTLAPFPTNGSESLPWSENSNFPTLLVNSLFKFSAQGRELAIGSKSKKPYEIKPWVKPWIKPSLISTSEIYVCIGMYQQILYSCSFTILFYSGKFNFRITGLTSLKRRTLKIGIFEKTEYRVLDLSFKIQIWLLYLL